MKQHRAAIIDGEYVAWEEDQGPASPAPHNRTHGQARGIRRSGPLEARNPTSMPVRPPSEIDIENVLAAINGYDLATDRRLQTRRQTEDLLLERRQTHRTGAKAETNGTIKRVAKAVNEWTSQTASRSRPTPSTGRPPQIRATQVRPAPRYDLIIQIGPGQDDQWPFAITIRSHDTGLAPPMRFVYSTPTQRDHVLATLHTKFPCRYATSTADYALPLPSNP
jgi:hypothetical protein